MENRADCDYGQPALKCRCRSCLRSITAATADRGGQRARCAFMLVELMVVIAIVILLLALLLPVIGTSVGSQRQAGCASQLRQLGANLLMLRDSPAGYDSTNWLIRVREDLLHCPEDVDRQLASSYGMNTRAHRFGDDDGGRIVLLDFQETVAHFVAAKRSEQDGWEKSTGDYAARHLGRINVLLHSGAVKDYAPTDIDPTDCELWERYWRPYLDRHISLEGCGGEPQGTDGAASPSSDRLVNEEPNYPEYDGVTCTSDDPITIDDGDAQGFTLEHDGSLGYALWPGQPWEIVFFTSEWKRIGGTSAAWQLHSDHHTVAPGHQSEGTRAIYEFKVQPGNEYRVYVYWQGEGGDGFHANQRDPRTGYRPYGHSDNTPIRVYDGDTMIGEERVNQKVSSSGAKFEYAAREGSRLYLSEEWYPLEGTFAVDSGTLKVSISADAGSDNERGSAEKFNVVADAVRIECVNAWPYHADACQGDEPKTIDNGDAGYQATGAWQQVDVADAVGASCAKAASGSGNETASYTFTNVAPGQHSVWTTFLPAPGQATNAMFTVSAGGEQFSPVIVNQSRPYVGTALDDDGRRWYKIGEYEVRADSQNVRVVVSDAADADVVADAMRLECSFESYDECDERNGIYGRECRQYYAEDYGATEETEKAVDDALNWLSRHQYEGGHWNFDHRNATGHYVKDVFDVVPCNGQCPNHGGEEEHLVAATGMGLLPFLGAGFGPTHDKYGKVVTAAIEYLIRCHSLNGRLATPNQYKDEGYEQGIGTLALAEALGICRQSGFGDVDEVELTQTVQSAIRRIVRCQNDESKDPAIYPVADSSDHEAKGGWRYACGADHDVSVTSWMVQAIVVAGELGVDYEGFAEFKGPGRGVMEDVRYYMHLDTPRGDFVEDPVYGTHGRRYAYGYNKYFAWGIGNQIGKFVQLAAGVSPQAKGMLEAADFEVSRISSPQSTEETFGVDAYREYYATHFMRRMGGGYWEDWNDAMKQYLLTDNPAPTKGHQRGSWLRNQAGSQIHSYCGRLWDTVSACLCLEVYYRYAKGI